MKYVSKPVMVEAQLFDSLASAMGWLKPGEFTQIDKDGIWLLDERKKAFNIPFDGQWYVVRANDGLAATAKGEFESMFIGMDDVVMVDFAAEGNEADGYVMSCTECGPIGHCATRDDFAPIAEEHMMAQHANRSREDCIDCDDEDSA